MGPSFVPLLLRTAKFTADVGQAKGVSTAFLDDWLFVLGEKVRCLLCSAHLVGYCRDALCM